MRSKPQRGRKKITRNEMLDATEERVPGSRMDLSRAEYHKAITLASREKSVLS